VSSTLARAPSLAGFDEDEGGAGGDVYACAGLGGVVGLEDGGTGELSSSQSSSGALHLSSSRTLMGSPFWVVFE
jgi:hypothetical protein